MATHAQMRYEILEAGGWYNEETKNWYLDGVHSGDRQHVPTLFGPLEEVYIDMKRHLAAVEDAKNGSADDDVFIDENDPDFGGSW